MATHLLAPFTILQVCCRRGQLSAGIHSHNAHLCDKCPAPLGQIVVAYLSIHERGAAILTPWFWLELGSFGRRKSGFTLCKISVQLYGTAPTTIDRRSPPHPGSAPFSTASCMRLETMRAWDFYLQVGTPTSVPLGPLTQTDCQPDGKSAGIP